MEPEGSGGQRKANFLSPEHIVSQMLEVFMPANSGNPRGAHPTGAAGSPIGTSGCQ